MRTDNTRLPCGCKYCAAYSREYSGNCKVMYLPPQKCSSFTQFKEEEEEEGFDPEYIIFKATGVNNGRT